MTAQARRNAAAMLAALEGLPGLRLPASDPGHSWQKFRVRTASATARERAMAALDEHLVPVCRWQVAAMPDHTAFRDEGAAVPEARALLEDSFLLFTERWPLHGQPDEVADQVAQTVQTVWQDPS